MEDEMMKILVWTTIAVVALWVSARNYAECRATPHTAFYCITNF